MDTEAQWTYIGSITTTVGFTRFSLFNKHGAKLRAALIMLNAILDFLGSGVLDMVPMGPERGLINRDTEKSLRDYFDVDKNVVIQRLGRGSIITLRVNPSLMVRMLMSCNGNCRCYVDDVITKAKDNITKYRDMAMNALSRLGRIFNIETPRVLLTHNPTVFGKIMLMGREEVITLSVWDILRAQGFIGGEPTVDGVSDIIDTVVHEFLHYLLDKRYLIPAAFIEMTKRIPSVFDDGIVHELITWTLTPSVSRYVAQCIKYGNANKVNIIDTYLIKYPVKRRHVIAARKVINELVGFLDGGCG